MSDATTVAGISRLASCGGCSAKMSPGELRALVDGAASARRDPARDPRLLVGTETSDDAAVYQLTDELAIVATTDFVTPVCDDPFLYGQIAAANALSDVYAMGGTPTVALAICGFPTALGDADARAILAGGAAKANEAGAAVVGGHTIRSPELFYGLAVTGTIHPRDVVRNAGARAGDALVLTKPLGTGLLINGVRGGQLSAAAFAEAAPVMTALNREASRAMVDARAHAATDVTGFGLVGHALGMARGSGVSLRISAARLPVYDHALALAGGGVKTKGTTSNQAHYQASVRIAAAVDVARAGLIYDPQTAGGLLIALDGDRADAFVATLRERGVAHATLIGEAVAGEGESTFELRP